VHTVLSFIATQDDPKGTIQRNLIDAAIQAKVKRFAPSEWASCVPFPPSFPSFDLVHG
jgi:NmrA-like family